MKVIAAGSWLLVSACAVGCKSTNNSAGLRSAEGEQAPQVAAPPEAAPETAPPAALPKGVFPKIQAEADEPFLTALKGRINGGEGRVHVYGEVIFEASRNTVNLAASDCYVKNYSNVLNYIPVGERNYNIWVVRIDAAEAPDGAFVLPVPTRPLFPAEALAEIEKCKAKPIMMSLFASTWGEGIAGSHDPIKLGYLWVDGKPDAWKASKRNHWSIPRQPENGLTVTKPGTPSTTTFERTFYPSPDRPFDSLYGNFKHQPIVFEARKGEVFELTIDATTRVSP